MTISIPTSPNDPVMFPQSNLKATGGKKKLNDVEANVENPEEHANFQVTTNTKKLKQIFLIR